GHVGAVDLCLPPIGSEPPERAGLRGLRSRRRVVLEAIDLYLRKLTGILRVDDDELPCHGRSAEDSLEFFRSDLESPGRLGHVGLERGGFTQSRDRILRLRRRVQHVVDRTPSAKGFDLALVDGLGRDRRYRIRHLRDRGQATYRRGLSSARQVLLMRAERVCTTVVLYHA